MCRSQYCFLQVVTEGMEYEILPYLTPPFTQVKASPAKLLCLFWECGVCSTVERLAPPGCWRRNGNGQMGTRSPEAQGLAGVLCCCRPLPWTAGQEPFSTVHRPCPVPQVRNPSARVGSSPSCPSSFYISLMMPWLKPPCSHVLGLPRDDRS